MGPRNRRALRVTFFQRRGGRVLRPRRTGDPIGTLVVPGLALLLLSLSGCDDQQSSKDAARDDRMSEVVHEQTDDQFNNMSDELSNLDARMNEVEATQTEITDEAQTEHQKTDDLESRLSDVERKTQQLPD